MTLCKTRGSQHVPAAYKRLGGFVFLAAVTLFSVQGCGGSDDQGTRETVEAKPTSSIPYSITQDEHRQGNPRNVEVLLPRRISETELAEVANAVRADGPAADKLFIGLRVEGQVDSAYWANASFTPDYQGNVIGTNAEDYEALRAVDMSGYEEVLGSWLQDGALGHVMVLYRKGGNHFIDQVFPSGAKNTSGYLAKQVAGGDLRLEEPENDFGEFYLLKADGTLEGWSENGRYLSLVPMVR